MKMVHINILHLRSTNTVWKLKRFIWTLWGITVVVPQVYKFATCLKHLNQILFLLSMNNSWQQALCHMSPWFCVSLPLIPVLILCLDGWPKLWHILYYSLVCCITHDNRPLAISSPGFVFLNLFAWLLDYLALILAFWWPFCLRMFVGQLFLIKKVRL